MKDQLPSLKTQLEIDEHFMGLALGLAQLAARLGEVPVGSLLVDKNNNIISKSFNKRETLKTPLAHAEIMTLHRAARVKNSWRLEDTTLYVTLEPCLMCSGAIIQARVNRVVFGAHDPKGGAASSLYQTLTDPRLNHRCEVVSGILKEPCSSILSSFFNDLRNKKKGQEK